MNPAILHKEVQDFINENLKQDLAKLIFKGSPFNAVNIQELAGQIEAKKKAQKKLPTWFGTQNVYYPNKLNMEQTSSEVTAEYKSNIISGDSIIDLTGGFGVDSYFFSKKFKKVCHCELTKPLSDIANHNFKALAVANIETIAKDGLEYLEENNVGYDWIYLDPSRRDNLKKKVFLLEDCLPIVPEHLAKLFKYSSNILIKVAPMLDISKAIEALNNVKEVHILAYENEVKELLFILEKRYDKPIILKSVHINKNEIEHFNGIYKTAVTATYALPKKYLYEPNAAILKAGLFNKVSNELKLDKLHVNSHLYTNNNLISFPGRRFKIMHISSYNKKALLGLIPTKKANITTRNFPDSVATIRNKTGLKEGGNTYLFFTTNTEENLIVLICEKV